MIKKYSVLICLMSSVVFLVIAMLRYPGGSLVNSNSIGFDLSKNFISNLFAAKAINGLENPGRVWAIIGMAFQSVGYGIFFINISKKIPYRLWAKILEYIGIANIILIFLIATPLHDIGVLSIILTLMGLFTITIFIFKTKLYLLKYACIFCLLTYYVFFSFYGFGFLSLAAIMQKVFSISSILLVLGIEYFTKGEDYIKVTFNGREL